MQGLLAYIENSQSPTSPYYVSEEALRSALGPLAARVTVVSASAASPDFESLKRADYFIGSGFDTERLRRHARSLRFAHCTSAGVEKYLPLNWLNEGASLTNSSGVHAEKGGAFGAMTVLMLCEEVPRHIENQRLHRWDSTLSTGAVGKTIVFVGFGSLGSAIAARLKPFGVQIISITRSGAKLELADESFTTAELDAILPRADCLVLCCPLTPETHGLIDKRRISLMKSGASLFNIARGRVLDAQALSQALLSGHLSGAALDVFNNEPLQPDDPTWDVPNLIIFPHISCDASEGYVDRCLAIFVDNVARDIAGEPLLNRVDPVAGY